MLGNPGAKGHKSKCDAKVMKKEILKRWNVESYIVIYIGEFMSRKGMKKPKELGIDKEILDKSIFNLPPEKIYDESITPLKVHWMAIENLNDVLIGNYLSMILLGLSTTFLGAWLTSSEEAQKSFLMLSSAIFLIIGAILHITLVYLKIRKWKKEAVKRSDFE